MWWLALVLLFAVCSGAGLYVATQKNRPPAEGALLGGLLGPFGVIVAALLPDISSSEPPAESRRETTPARDSQVSDEQALDFLSD